MVWGNTLALSFFIVYVGLFRPCHFVLYGHTSALPPLDSLTHTVTVIPVLIWDWDQKDFEEVSPRCSAVNEVKQAAVPLWKKRRIRVAGLHKALFDQCH